jgi:hypothetical protein
MFFQNYSKPGPGVSSDEPRKKGAARLFEVLFRDFGNLWKAGLFALFCMLPGITGVVLGLMGGGVLIVLLSGLVGGVIAGPCLVGLFDTLARALRDEPGYWWHTYKMAVKRSAKASLLPGALSGLFLSASVMLIYMLLVGGVASLPGWLLCIAYLLLTVGALPYLWMQVALLDMPIGQMLKNTFSMWFGFFPRTLLASAFQIGYWLAVIAFFPFSEFVLVLTSLWLPATLAGFAIYKPFEAAFHIEASVRRLHEQQRDAMPDDRSPEE